MDDYRKQGVSVILQNVIPHLWKQNCFFIWHFSVGIWKLLQILTENLTTGNKSHMYHLGPTHSLSCSSFCGSWILWERSRVQVTLYQYPPPLQYACRVTLCANTRLRSKFMLNDRTKMACLYVEENTRKSVNASVLNGIKNVKSTWDHEWMLAKSFAFDDSERDTEIKPGKRDAVSLSPSY